MKIKISQMFVKIQFQDDTGHAGLRLFSTFIPIWLNEILNALYDFQVCLIFRLQCKDFKLFSMTVGFTAQAKLKLFC